MRQKTLEQLREMSRDIAGSIVMAGGNRRQSTDREREVLYNKALRAVWTYNGYISVGYNREYLRGAAQALCDMSEANVDDWLPGCNGYLTIYNPLQEIFRHWDAEDDISDDEWIPEF